MIVDNNYWTMKTIIRSLLTIKILIVTLYLLLVNSSVVGQSTTTPIQDSITQEFKSIKISEISIKSGEVFSETKRLKESIISMEKIETIKSRNDSIIHRLDSLLIIDREIDLNSKNTRFLSNKLVYWKKLLDLLSVEKTDLAYEIRILNDYKKKCIDDILIWKNTKSIIEEKESESSIIKRVDMLLLDLDSLKLILQTKSDALLVSLNKTTEAEVVLNDLIVKIDQTYVEKKKEIFVQNEPSIFSIDYRDPNKRSLIVPLKDFYNSEIKEFLFFMDNKLPSLTLQLVFLVVLIVLFIRIKHKLASIDVTDNSFYRRVLVKVMSQSVSAALIVGVFLSSSLFSDRPEILKDFLVLIVTIPLMLIARTLVKRRFYQYIYLLGAVIILNFFYIIFPPDNLYYMVILMLAAIIELYVLSSLIVYFQKNKLKNGFFNGFVILILFIHLFFAFAGFIGLLYGSTTLAEVAINVPVANIFSGLLVFSTIIVLNGFISFGIDSSYLHRLNIIRFHGDTIKRRAISIVNIVLVIFWILGMLNLLNLKRIFLEALTEFFTNEINIGSASFNLADIFMFFIVIWLSVVISKMIRIILEQDILNNFKLEKGLPHTIAVMVRYSLIAIGVLLAITAAGMPLDSLTVMAGAFGVGIGFGLQNIFNNIVSGFILLFERPIQIGDTIEVKQLIGKVQSIGIRSSNIKTFEGADVIVPNGQLISNEVVNWTLSDQKRRIEVMAGVAYGTDPHKVEELFTQVLNEHADILDDPAPNVFFQGLGDSSLDFRLLFWTSKYHEWIRIRSDIVFGVHDILVKEGINIPFPQMDLHLKSIEKGVDLVKTQKK